VDDDTADQRGRGNSWSHIWTGTASHARFDVDAWQLGVKHLRLALRIHGVKGEQRTLFPFLSVTPPKSHLGDPYLTWFGTLQCLSTSATLTSAWSSGFQISSEKTSPETSQLQIHDTMHTALLVFLGALCLYAALATCCGIFNPITAGKSCVASIRYYVSRASMLTQALFVSLQGLTSRRITLLSDQGLP
jgi:hypothetical protein